jgi:hypothetical protein
VPRHVPIKLLNACNASLAERVGASVCPKTGHVKRSATRPKQRELKKRFELGMGPREKTVSISLAMTLCPLLYNSLGGEKFRRTATDLFSKSKAAQGGRGERRFFLNFLFFLMMEHADVPATHQNPQVQLFMQF